jgi:hypothetical protein
MTGASDKTLALLASGNFWDGLRSFAADRREQRHREFEIDGRTHEDDCKTRGAIEELRVLLRLQQDVEEFLTNQTKNMAATKINR